MWAKSDRRSNNIIVEKKTKKKNDGDCNNGPSSTTIASSASSKLISRFNRQRMLGERMWRNADTPSTVVDESKAILDMERHTLVQLDSSAEDTTKYILILGTVAILVTAGALAVAMAVDLGIDLEWTQFTTDPTGSFGTVLEALETLDVQKGMIYFSSFYILAEILAIPVFPLTASSGFLFGTIPGTAICLVCAATAASISFVIGRTLLRGYVESVLAANPKLQSIDRAIEKGGFKLMLLVRLSPVFPFALSNYLYGTSGIGFVPYFLGSILGFLPGTFAYVYAGRVGKALTIDSASSAPWYVYVGGLTVVLILLKIASDVASGVIKSLDDEHGDIMDKNDIDIR